MTRRRKLISIYLGIARTYLRRSPTLLGAAIFVFVPLGLIDALAAEVDLDALDLSSGVKVAALIAAVSAVTATSLLGEVFYSGVVAVSLTHPEGEPPPTLMAIARRLRYWRLIAIDLIYVALVLLGMIALVVPGVLFFVWFGLSGPVVEIEEQTVRGALRRSWELVRSNFWVVFFVLVPVEIVGDSLAEAVASVVHGLLGDSLVAGWLAESVSNILLSPIFAIAAVLLTLDLIAEKDGVAEWVRTGLDARTDGGMIYASFISDFWNNHILAHERQGVFFVLVGFILSFAFIRMSTRLMRSPKVPWWPGSVVSESGVHLHHLVFGIVAMMIAGTLGFAVHGDSPWAEICGFFFGVGAGLTIDEFALWVHLEDVYWAKEGRSSIDATVIAAAAIGLVVVGVNPLDLGNGESEGVAAVVVSGFLLFSVVAICFLKGRNLHGIVGFFVFPVALYGSCRIGKPSSAWARRRYGERRPKKQAKAEKRFPPDRRTERFKEAFRDIVGGKPSEGVAAARDEALAATREAGEEVRQRAEQVTHAADLSHRDEEK